MRPDELEARMRRLEWFHSLRVPEGAWTILRLDGRGFSGFTQKHCEKPFDANFHTWMLRTSQALFESFQALYAYTESDEISLLFAPTWDLFDRELEKVVSLSAGLASATFSLACGQAVHFDCRVIVAVQQEQLIDYFRWRQADAARCALNGWSYWTLRNKGQSTAEATQALVGAGVADKHELLWQAGINFNDLPLWQRRGTGLYWQDYQREGYNPKLQQTVLAHRRQVKIDEELPVGEEYADFLSRLIARTADV